MNTSLTILKMKRIFLGSLFASLLLTSCIDQKTNGFTVWVFLREVIKSDVYYSYHIYLQNTGQMYTCHDCDSNIFLV